MLTPSPSGLSPTHSNANSGSSPIVLPSGTIVQTRGTGVVALTPSGTVVWNTSLDVYYYFGAALPAALRRCGAARNELRTCSVSVGSAAFACAGCV